MSEPFVGQIIPVAFNFAPIGWVLCDGRTLPINEYSALYQLIGTTYGGDGQTSFAVPDLRSRCAIGMGQGAGLQPYLQGQASGTESVTLNSSQIAAHTHTLSAAATVTDSTPTTAMVLGTPADEDIYATSGTTTTLSRGSVSSAVGNGLPHENRQPYQAVNYIMAFSGIFPSHG